MSNYKPLYDWKLFLGQVKDKVLRTKLNGKLNLPVDWRDYNIDEMLKPTEDRLDSCFTSDGGTGDEVQLLSQHLILYIFIINYYID